MTKLLRFFAVFSILTTIVSCEKNNEIPTNPIRPEFTTVEVGDITSQSVSAYTSFTYDGTGEISAVGFAYKTNDQIEYTYVKCDNWNDFQPTATITGLQAETQYRVYCYAEVNGERTNSLSRTFTTLNSNEDGDTPKFGTPSAENIKPTEATLSCTLTYDGTEPITEAGFEYKASTASSYTKAEVTASAGTKTVGISGLTESTTYSFYLYAIVKGVKFKSSVQTFSTDGSGDQTPKFGTPTSSNVTQTGATLSCTITYDGAKPITEAGFEYKASTASSYTKAGVTASAGTKTVIINGLAQSTTYSYYLYAIVDGVKYKSTEQSFSTTGGGGQSGARYNGWAELPVEKIQSGENYFAYHLCPDVNVPGTSQKRRNYAVCYSNSKKCAIWVAAPMHDCYAVKNTDRTNAYKADPNIPISQPGKWDGYTRGHMLGSAERLVSNQTNRQVFYYSNIAPQLSTYFNTGGGAWNTLEDWVDTQWANKQDTTYQVIGSYWKTTNKVVSGTTIPTHYYKVLLRTKGHKNKWVVDCSRDELQCIAIMVEHKTYSKSEVPDPNEYISRGMVYTVKQMEEMTGVTFFPNVPNAPKDTYNRSDWGL